MRLARSLIASMLLLFAGIGLMAATPGQADAQYYRWHGVHRYPYYWSGYYGGYSPYNAYNYNYNWYGRYGGYYGSYPYYSWSRAYPWGWYW